MSITGSGSGNLTISGTTEIRLRSGRLTYAPVFSNATVQVETVGALSGAG